MLNFGFATPKRHIFARKHDFWRILCQCSWSHLGCRWWIEPKNSQVNNPHEVAHAWKRNPLSNFDKVLQGGRYPGRNHLRKLWWRLVKGSNCGGGSNFALPHHFSSSPSDHSCITVQVCDTPPCHHLDFHSLDQLPFWPCIQSPFCRFDFDHFSPSPFLPVTKAHTNAVLLRLREV